MEVIGGRRGSVDTMSPRKLSDDLLELLFPPRCQLCGSFASDPLCESCSAEALLVESPWCLYCGTPLAPGRCPEQLCAECRAGRWLSGMRAAGLHAEKLREAVIRYKFEGRTRLAATFGEMLARLIEAEARQGGLPLRDCAALVPVPLHRNRRRWRGFDQTELLCEVIAERVGIAIWTDIMTRVRDTPPQVQVSGSRRRENVQGAFEVTRRAKVAGECIILVDDVFTTGATMEECALELRRAGAAAVFGLTITRGAPGWHPAALGFDLPDLP